MNPTHRLNKTVQTDYFLTLKAYLETLRAKMYRNSYHDTLTQPWLDFEAEL